MALADYTASPPPYQCIAAMLNDPVIHSDETGAIFISGYADGLGRRVVLHNQKGNKQTGRQGAYFAKWQKAGPITSLLPLERRFESKTFDNILDVELFLRPGDDDHTWIDGMDTDLVELIGDLISDENALCTEATSVKIEALEKICDPRCRELAPERFKVPYRVRCALKDLICARRTRSQVPEECEDMIAGIKNKIDGIRDCEQIKRYP